MSSNPYLNTEDTEEIIKSRVFGVGVEKSHKNNAFDSVIENEVFGNTHEEVETREPTLQEIARARTEQANLYMILMEHSVFAEGSARPEILEAVEREIRDFAGQKLAELLGITSVNSTTKQAVTMPFDEEEVEILKSLASKVKDKIQTKESQVYTPPVPKVNSIGSSAPLPKPELNPAASKPQAKQKVVSAPLPPLKRSSSVAEPQPSEKTKQKNVKKSKSKNNPLSEVPMSNLDKNDPEHLKEIKRRLKIRGGQVVSSDPEAPKPLPMPSINHQAEIWSKHDAINQKQVNIFENDLDTKFRDIG